MRLHPTSYYCFPGHCLLCGSHSQRTLDLCLNCEQDLPRSSHNCSLCALPLPAPGICGRCQTRPPPFSRVICPLLYQHPINKLIQQLKYSTDLVAARVLCELLIREVIDQVKDTDMPDLIMPIPLHWRRKLFRGFNQSQQLAEQLSKKLNIPLDNRSIRRIKPTVQQQKLTFKERSKNLRNAFRCRKNLFGMRIVLVDDVVTSGATVNTVADILKKANAADVQVWCLARTPLFK